MHANDVAPGQDATPTQPARADKTRETTEQRSADVPTGGGNTVLTEVEPSSTPRGSRTAKTKRTVNRGRVGGKGTKTKRKAGAGGGVVRRGVKSKATGSKGRTKAKRGPKKSGRKTTAKRPKKVRAGTGKAGGKRNR